MDKYDYLDLSMTADAAYRAIQYRATLDDHTLDHTMDHTMNSSVQRSRNISRRISLPASRMTKIKNVKPNVVSNTLTDVDQTRITTERDIFSIQNNLRTNIGNSTVISHTSSHSRVTSTPKYQYSQCTVEPS